MVTLINVLGHGRSGTTMLDLMLGNGSEAFSCGEVYAWFRPWRTHHFDTICSCADGTRCPVWLEARDLPEARFHKGVAELTGSRFVIDSSKQPSWVYDTQRWAESGGYDVYNLALWKDPVDLAHSLWKRGGDIMDWRRSFIRYFNEILELDVPFHAVHFGRLTEDPASTLRTVCEVVGLPWRTDRERFWEGDHHHLFGSMGTRRQVELGESRIASGSQFEDGFEEQLDYLQEQLSEDTELQGLLDLLERRDVSQAEPRVPHRHDPPARLPMWFHTAKVKRTVRRRFPQRWEHAQ